MKKLNKIRTVILGLLLLVAIVSNAQQAKVAAAYTFLQQGNLDSAKANIDAAVVNHETENDAQAWQVRGFIYKAIYNTKEKSNRRSPARLEALVSLKKSLSLDADKELFTENIGAVKYFANTFHNDAAESLDPIDYKTAIELFNKSQECFRIVDPTPASIQANEIEFDLALVSVYNSVLETDKNDSVITYKFVALARNVYNKILAMEPDNVKANYGMGILYYNQAVNLIKSQDYDLDLITLAVVEDKSAALFKTSLPFMEKAYALDPNRVDALQGLSGIYFSLHEDEKYNLFRQKLEDIKKPK